MKTASRKAEKIANKKQSQHNKRREEKDKLRKERERKKNVLKCQHAQQTEVQTYVEPEVIVEYKNESIGVLSKISRLFKR